METKYLIKHLAEKYDSFYLYDEASIVNQINILKTNFPSVEFLYSVKCNPHKNILKSIFKKNFGAQVSSSSEVNVVSDMGLFEDKIFYSAPGKSMEDLKNAIHKSTIIADSISEIKRLKYLAEVLGEQIRIGVRINPSFTFEKDESLPSPFGIDEKEAIDYVRKLDPLFVKVEGIYCHIKSQELDCSKINRYHKKVFQLGEKFEIETGCKLDFINLGSGIGIPYSTDDKEFNIQWLGKEMEERITNFRIHHPRTRIIMECGRFLTGHCGNFVTHVIDKKISRGKNYVILQNTFNGFIKPVLSFMVNKFSSSENPKSFEPLFTKSKSFKIEIPEQNQEKETVTLMGNSCTESDIIGENLLLPKLKIGDLIIFNNAGSYAASLSPMNFSGLPEPKQLFFTVDGLIIEEKGYI